MNPQQIQAKRERDLVPWFEQAVISDEFINVHEHIKDDEPPIPQQINIDDIAYELVQYSDGRFIEIHEEADVGEGIGEEDEKGEWEDFETSEEENIETYVEENDSSDE
ncbi:hypothetical protein SLEP1_g51801 [Rubroshorea leprosula]|uniref:Uncharacterized protein n=1 Tax=Rubroshorea leprosula TaxID=152421 RepID=A0AAV5M5X9_9ROSI|nr:hypothetical protein SLEP1_g51801 [Rubroshorea leprosula]